MKENKTYTEQFLITHCSFSNYYCLNFTRNLSSPKKHYSSSLYKSDEVLVFESFCEICEELEIVIDKYGEIICNDDCFCYGYRVSDWSLNFSRSQYGKDANYIYQLVNSAIKRASIRKKIRREMLLK